MGSRSPTGRGTFVGAVIRPFLKFVLSNYFGVLFAIVYCSERELRCFFFFLGGGIPQLSIRDGLLWMNGVRCSVWLRGRGGVAGLGGRAFRRPSAGPLQSHARHVAPHVPPLALGRQLRQLHRHRSVTVAYHSPLVAAIRPSVRLLACRMPLVQKHCIAGL